MSRRGESPVPPSGADAFLGRWLPEGPLGLSVIGDLHQEYDERIQGGQSKVAADWWYWRNAVVLGTRYAIGRLNTRTQQRHPRRGRGVETMGAFTADLRFGFRMLAKTPMLSVIAILTIALGVAITSSTFSMVYGSILRGLPVPGEERLMVVEHSRPDLGVEGAGLRPHEYQDLLRSQSTFEDLGAYYQGTVNLAGDGGAPERFGGAFVSANTLSHLGVPPLRGRTFLPGEDSFDAPPVLVIGFHVWRNRFASDPDVIGRRVRMNGETAEIVGVMPEGFAFPFNEEIWTPNRLDLASLEWDEGPEANVFGKLREGASLEDARTELAAVTRQQARQHPETNENWVLTVQPFEHRFMPPEIRAVLWVMLGATLGVLLIACVNVANLLLARASLRSREVAVRTALGASRFRVMRQMLVESLVLAAVGGTLGLFLAAWGTALYENAVAGIVKPFWLEARMDLPTVLFTIGVTALAALAAGMLPGLRASGVQLGDVLRDESRGGSSLRLGRFSSSLVVTEIALSASLLVAAGFMVRSVVNLRSVDMGFRSENVLAGQITLAEADYPTQQERSRFFEELRRRLMAQPGVTAASLGSTLPGLGSHRYFISIEGQAYETDAAHPVVNAIDVTEDYFETFSVDVLRGRDFSALDRTDEAEPVAIVSESLARRHFPSADPLGARVRLGTSESTRPWHTIVGIVPDMYVGGGVGGIGDDRLSPERLFFPQGALGRASMAFAIRTPANPEELMNGIRTLVSELDPNLPVYQLAALDRQIDEAMWAFDLFASFFTIFGLAALFLAAVGLYGVMAFSVAQRRTELGIRMALGAERGEILGIVLRKGGRQLLVGMGVGLLLGAVMAGPMRFILYGVETGDAVVYLGVVGTLGLAGLLACLIPARSATRTEPVEAMRAS